ncbi:unnamed protein product [Paramecium octaurelia]|uniref:Uncharacterized protein n=1 Tax=Paramecium octaurelia TaxID=43137 RepID=A0A8S1XVC6_PAROT|nr:unnamed protein product [Paramecium octaurelia]
MFRNEINLHLVVVLLQRKSKTNYTKNSKESTRFCNSLWQSYLNLFINECHKMRMLFNKQIYVSSRSGLHMKKFWMDTQRAKGPNNIQSTNKLPVLYFNNAINGLNHLIVIICQKKNQESQINDRENE